MNQIRNPKAEGRRSKEGRNPRTETRNLKVESEGAISGLNPGYLSELSSGDGLELREGGPAPAPQALGERTSQFGEAIIRFAKKIPASAVNERLISQLVGAATSIGANYCEADDSVSGKEFKVKIGTCRKESKETMFFLRLLATAEPKLAPEARVLWREAKELNLIFGAIWRK